MGMRPYLKTEEHIRSFGPNEIIMEIGSERGEASTQFYTLMAEKYNSRFITVDINDIDFNNWYNCLPDRLKTLVKFYQQPGSKFAREVFPSLDLRIKCLYLDNYDWIWNPADMNRPYWLDEQIKWYKSQHQIDMNNLDCQVEHLSQMMYLLPYMSQESVVICDDTYRISNNNAFTGKCGAVVPYLLANDYKIVDEGGGVILKRE